MALHSREALAERLAHEEALKARLARLEAQYDRLEHGLLQIEAEMEINGSADAAATEVAVVERTKRPRKPR